MQNKPESAVIYVRTLQPREDDIPLREQEAVCKVVCAEHGWPVSATFKDTDRPQTASGWLGREEAMRTTIAQSGVLVVYDLARLVRTANEGVEMFNRLVCRCAHLYVATGECTPRTTDPEWEKTASLIQELWRVQRGLSGSLKVKADFGENTRFRPFGADKNEKRELNWLVWRKSHGFSAAALSAELKYRGIQHQSRSGSPIWWSPKAIGNLYRKISIDEWRKKLERWAKLSPSKQPGFDRFDVYVNRMLPEMYMGNRVHPKDGAFVVPKSVVTKVLDKEGKLQVDLETALDLIRGAVPNCVPEHWRKACEMELRNRARKIQSPVAEEVIFPYNYLK